MTVSNQNKSLLRDGITGKIESPSIGQLGALKSLTGLDIANRWQLFTDLNPVSLGAIAGKIYVLEMISISFFRAFGGPSVSNGVSVNSGSTSLFRWETPFADNVPGNVSFFKQQNLFVPSQVGANISLSLVQGTSLGFTRAAAFASGFITDA